MHTAAGQIQRRRIQIDDLALLTGGRAGDQRIVQRRRCGLALFSDGGAAIQNQQPVGIGVGDEFKRHGLAMRALRIQTAARLGQVQRAVQPAKPRPRPIGRDLAAIGQQDQRIALVRDGRAGILQRGIQLGFQLGRLIFLAKQRAIAGQAGLGPSNSASPVMVMSTVGAIRDSASTCAAERPPAMIRSGPMAASASKSGSNRVPTLVLSASAGASEGGRRDVGDQRSRSRQAHSAYRWPPDRTRPDFPGAGATRDRARCGVDLDILRMQRRGKGQSQGKNSSFHQISPSAEGRRS